MTVHTANTRTVVMAAATTTGGPSPSPPPPPPEDDTYATQINKLKQNSAFGVDANTLMKLQSGGKEDYSKQIQFSIRRQYFTFSQVWVIAAWALSFGALIGALAVALTTPDAFIDMSTNPGMVWGVFLLSMGITDLLSESKAHRNIRKCTRDKFESTADAKKYGKTGKEDPKVESEYQGRDCMTDWDCTRRSKVPAGVCALPKPNALARAVRKVGTPMLLLVGIALTATTFTSTDFRLEKKDLAQAIIYGIAFGNLLAIVFS